MPEYTVGVHAYNFVTSHKYFLHEVVVGVLLAKIFLNLRKHSLCSLLSVIECAGICSVFIEGLLYVSSAFVLFKIKLY